MRAIRVDIDLTTASFRYPGIVTGRQPTFDLPPPSTIYGHLASALGEHFDPGGVRFGYSLQSEGRVDDYEHRHILSVAGGRARLDDGHPKNLQGEVTPGYREMLFRLRGHLYIAGGDLSQRLFQALRAPRYPVILGRSQDLGAYREVKWVELEAVNDALLVGTLLPFALRQYSRLGTTVLVPQHLPPDDRRKVSWSRFVSLTERAVASRPGGAEQGANRLQWPQGIELLADPSIRPYGELPLGVVLHRLGEGVSDLALT